MMFVCVSKLYSAAIDWLNGHKARDATAANAIAKSPPSEKLGREEGAKHWKA